MSVRYPEYIPDEAEARRVRKGLGDMAHYWNGVCVSRTPVEDTRPFWQRLLNRGNTRPPPTTGEADMSIHVVDEKGEKRDTLHGVTAAQWMHVVNVVRGEMGTPEGLSKMGLGRLHCEDPDCARLCRSSGPALATYVLLTDKPPVAVIEPSYDNHPVARGTYLCGNCARVAEAKRRIDATRREAQ